MEAVKGPLWEFGPNRVKAVGDDPRILIDSANTHTPPQHSKGLDVGPRARNLAPGNC